MIDGTKGRSKRVLRDATLYVFIALLLWGLTWIVSREKGEIVGDVVASAFLKAIEIIVAVFIIIGLIQVWVSPEQLSQLLGKGAGWKAFAFSSTVPIFLGGSLFTILPLMQTIRHKGASIGAVATFITAWGGKAPLLPLEVEFLAARFALLRLVLVVPFAISVGLLVEPLATRLGDGKTRS